MADLDTVISGLEHCIQGIDGCQQDCPYTEYSYAFGICRTLLEKDALKLLKERQDIVKRKVKRLPFSPDSNVQWT